MEVTLKRERPVLTVNIGDDEQKRVPLTFTRAEMEELGSADDTAQAMYTFFGRYLGDVVEMLGDDDLSALFDAWREAREELGMPDMGEPSASPES